jgi:hypothetical protein
MTTLVLPFQTRTFYSPDGKNLIWHGFILRRGLKIDFGLPQSMRHEKRQVLAVPLMTDEGVRYVLHEELGTKGLMN